MAIRSEFGVLVVVMLFTVGFAEVRAQSQYMDDRVLVRLKCGVIPPLMLAAPEAIDSVLSGYPDLHGMLDSAGVSMICSTFPGVEHADTISTNTLGEQVLLPDLADSYVAFLSPGQSPDSTLTFLAAREEVVYCELDHVALPPTTPPNDPLFPAQWSLHRSYSQPPPPLCFGGINVDENILRAWDFALGTGVRVGVGDTGIQAAHEDLGGRVEPGPDFTAFFPYSSSSEDACDHGTPSAGIVAATRNNALGVSGLAPEALPVAIKIYGSSSCTTPTSAATMGIDYARTSGIPILLTSTVLERSTAMGNASSAYFLTGGFHVGPMGNDGIEQAFYPAGFRASTHAVGAMTNNGSRWLDPFVSACCYGGCTSSPLGPHQCGSNTGDWIDIVVPGGRNIVSTGMANTYRDCANPFGGTSAAGPHLVGLAALLKSYRPQLLGDDIGQILNLTAQDIGDPGWDAATGYGLARIDRALRYVGPPRSVYQTQVSGLTQVSSFDTQVSFFDAPSVPRNQLPTRVYTLRTTIAFPTPFASPPDVWVRASGSSGVNHTGGTYRYFDKLFGGRVISVTNTECTVETDVYRITNVGQFIWFPTTLGAATVAITAVGQVDNEAPSQVADLIEVLFPNGTCLNCARVAWTAPEDDQNSLNVDSYEARFSTEPIDATNFEAATLVSPQPTPHISGFDELFTISGLDPCKHYYVAIRSGDVSDQNSALSDVVQASTRCAPDHACAPNVHVESGNVLACPLGDGAGRFRVDATLACTVRPSQTETRVCLVKQPESSPGIVVWDSVRPGIDDEGDTLDVASLDVETQQAVFEATRISGCGSLVYDLYVDDLLILSDIIVNVRSFDFDPQTVGAVDPGDSTQFGPAFFAQNPCVDFDFDGTWSASDQALMLGHQPHAGHHIDRKLTVPNTSLTWYPQEVNGIHWLPGQGPNSTVSLYYYRDSDPTLHTIIDYAADDGHQTWQLPAGLSPGTDYRVKLVHRWTNWPDSYADLGRDVSDVPFEVGDPGCPYVQTWTGSEWKSENSILARSPESGLSEDAYLIKAAPDRSGGRLKFRILENADEFTTLDRASIAALDVAEGEKVLRAGNRYVAGEWEPATRVAKVSGEEITHLTDGSRAEYYIGSPGETLLVDLPPRRAIPGLEAQDGFPTTQGGGGSGGSGGGKGIDPAPEGPPDLTTAGAALDERYLTSTGILVQFRNGNGDWETVQHWYPREHFDDFVVDGFTEGQMRLVFLGKHKLRYLGRFNYLQDGVTPKAARLLSASHTRLGDQLSAVQGTDESATIIAPGDTVTFEFETVAPEAGKTRHWFLVTSGVYSSAAPQGYDAEPTAPTVPIYSFALGAARPNPTSGNVRIDYTLAHEANVSMRIYNVAGRLVRDLVGERQKAGPYNLTWNLRDNGGVQVPSGVYFYRLIADEWTSQKKVVFIER